MPEFLRGELQAAAEPLVVLGRLVVAMLLGGVVAWIYQRTRPASDTVVVSGHHARPARRSSSRW